ncbi:hypothetical protein PV327_007845 [Microctonus hyperodae]|uniref:BHLH domain-containing protein n=1 Tax=Microctonus hyperodae TaxID=165561 RepID=A0AA39KYX2_MICHY|nr:hypothetical protein PV327_007845 [Microctonus hyperodae]
MMSFEYPHPISRTYQYKKITKPLLERKRRARINQCLEELKIFMMETFESESEDISKLEKADILEMTVRHLQKLQESGSSFSSIDTNKGDGAGKYRWQLGFDRCAEEACRFLASLPGDFGGKLAEHLASDLQTSYRINVQIPPKVGIIPLLNTDINIPVPPVNTDVNIPLIPHNNTNINYNHTVTSNATTPLQISESSQVSSQLNPQQYTKIFEEVVNNPPINVRAQENILAPKNIIPPASSSVNNSSNILSQNSSEMDVDTNDKNEEEEEIDVEKIDDIDPMWRPW